MELSRRGLLLEAVVWQPHGPIPRSEPNGLAGTARVVPLAPGEAEPSSDPEAPGGPWREGARTATVLGPAGPDGLLAEVDGLALLLRGARLHLPPGARLRIAWEGSPRPLDRSLPRLGAAAPVSLAASAAPPGPASPPVISSFASRAAQPPSSAAAANGPATAFAANGPAPLSGAPSPSPIASMGSMLEVEPGTARAPAASPGASLEGSSKPAAVLAPPAGADGAPAAGASTAPAGTTADCGPAAASPAGAAPVGGDPESGPEASGRASVPDLEGTPTLVPRAPTTTTDLLPLGEAARRLAGFLGLAVDEEDHEEERRGREHGSDGAPDPEEGRSQLVVVLPELGRVRMLLAWSSKGVELAIHGLPPLRGVERASFLQAFEAALAAAGARGRAVLVARGAATTTEPPAGAESAPASQRERRGAIG